MRETIDGFLERIGKKRSLATVEAYGRDLRRFAAFLEERGLAGGFGAVTPTHILGFLSQSSDSFAPASDARALSAIKTFYGDLLRRGLVPSDPSEDVAPPIIGKQNKRGKPGDFSGGVAGGGASDFRNRAILSLLAEGVKPSQITRAETSDAIEGGNALLLRTAGGGRDVIRLKNPGPLIAYLVAREGREKGGGEGALFLNRAGKALTRQYVWKLLTKYKELYDNGSNNDYDNKGR